MQEARLIVSGLSGGSGKTIVSLGLTRAFARMGFDVLPGKKGPDYIDAAWLSLAAGRPATNFDPFFLSAPRLRAQCRRLFENWEANINDQGRQDDGEPQALALIEGNRGLYDGRDLAGSCSTAQLARVLECPVIVSLNCTKMTRTAAAVVAGLMNFEPDIRLAGIILNNIGSPRHAQQSRQAIEHYTGLPVLGMVPRLAKNPLPERHMGLELNFGAPGQAFIGSSPALEKVLEELADLISDHIDLAQVWEIACHCPSLLEEDEKSEKNEEEEKNSSADATLAPADTAETQPFASGPKSAAEDFWQQPVRILPRRPRLGVVLDKALWFYYAENFESLERAGAKLCFVSLFSKEDWPELDGLYLGGGYPELFAQEIAQSRHLNSIARLAHGNKPIYAECGGFMVLCESLHIDGHMYPMAALLPAQSFFHPRPQGLGYVQAETVQENPFHPLHSVWPGHEFHYSNCQIAEPDVANFVLCLHSGVGMGRCAQGPRKGSGQDGLAYRKVFASYTHLFAPAVPHWAPAFVDAALA